MGTESVDLLIQRAQVLRPRNVHQALNLLDDALALAQQFGYKQGIAQVIREKAACQLAQQQYKHALTAYTEALQFYRDLNDRKGQLGCLSELANIYFKLGDCPSCLTYVLESLKLHTDAGDSEGIAQSYNEIGKIYIYLQDYQNAIGHFRKALRIYEGLKLRTETVNSFFYLGNAYNWADDHDKSLYYLLRAQNALDEIRDIEIRTKVLGSLAILHTKLKEYDKALGYFNEALRIAEDGAGATVKAQLKKSLGNLYIELTQYDKAIEVLHDALKAAQESPLEAQLVKIHQFLATAYEKIGDFPSALEHFKKYFDLDREILSEEVSLKTKSLHIKYDLEELRKQKEIAELSDKLKEQFLANVSHEIRTPMNGVLGMAHLLARTNPTREQQEYIDAIRLSANNLMVIINDILDFSKINAGKVEFSETEFNVRELVKGIVQILQVKAEEKKIQIGCTFDYHVKDVLVGDPIRLNQILVNLMGNAVKFTEKGKVSLDIRVLESREQSCRLRFRVTDTGIGIPDNKLHKIFESFEQVEDHKRRFEGTGLGLTIVKQLVELQGGSIAVRSRVGEGSEFTVDLNFRIGKQTRPEAEPAPAATEPKDVRHVRVLVVEDNKVNQLLVRNMLRKFGFEQFDTASNGRKALECLRTQDYDIVLMDIQMPEMDGYEITREIRQRMRKEIRQVPIIALTADASDKEKKRAREAGMNDYVVKPYTPEELFGAMAKFIPETASISSRSSLPARKAEPGMNLDFLEKYTGGDQELAIQLIDIFLRQLPDAISKLEYCIPRKEWKQVHAVAHKLKSSVSIFELSELKKRIIKIEEYARDGEKLDEVPRLFSEVKELSRIAARNLEAAVAHLRSSVGS
jgi:hypothetical protein